MTDVRRGGDIRRQRGREPPASLQPRSACGTPFRAAAQALGTSPIRDEPSRARQQTAARQCSRSTVPSMSP